MSTEEQTFQTELSAVVVWLTLRPTDWCIFYAGQGPRGPYLDVAVDADAPAVAAILHDLADEGFDVGVADPIQVAQANSHRLRVRLHYGGQFRALARGSAIRCPIFGRLLPVAAVAAAPAAVAA